MEKNLKEQEKTKLLTLCFHALDSMGGLKRCAERFGVKSGTLYNQLNPNSAGHTFPAWSLLHTIKITQDQDLLNWIGKHCGLVIIPIRNLTSEKPVTAQLTSAILNAAQGFGEVAETLNQALSPDSDHGEFISPQELEQLEMKIHKAKTSFELISVLARQHHAAEKAHSPAEAS